MKPATVRVLRLLEARGSEGITGLDALAICHVYRLSGRIHEIRHDENDPREVQTGWREIDGARFALYRLAEYAPRPRPDAGSQVGAGL